MPNDLRLILSAVLDEYRLHWSGYHGIAHWARVLEIGRHLAPASGANIEVVSLFAVLHDSRRESEGHDPQHGPRAAKFAEGLRGTLIDLPDDEFELLHIACTGHTHVRTHKDVTVRTCWDSDRLDLGRVGIMPDPYYLGTDLAKDPKTILWADGRASMEVIPALVTDEWEIDLRGR